MGRQVEKGKSPRMGFAMQPRYFPRRVGCPSVVHRDGYLSLGISYFL